METGTITHQNLVDFPSNVSWLIYQLEGLSLECFLAQINSCLIAYSTAYLVAYLVTYLVAYSAVYSMAYLVAYSMAYFAESKLTCSTLSFQLSQFWLPRMETLHPSLERCWRCSPWEGKLTVWMKVFFFCIHIWIGWIVWE